MTEEQIAEAKRWDLLSYLQAYEPGELKKSGPREYRTRSHDSLVISNGKWHWCSRNMGGRTALDYLIKVRGQDFVSAVETLCGGGASPFLSQLADLPPPKPFELPEPNRYATKVMGYLQGRGIDGGIISRCLRDGSLYESFRYHNCVFVGRDTKGKARFACLRGTFGDFKMDVPGSDKRFNFCLASPLPGCQKVAVFESAIDALSGATLTKLAGKAWEDACYLSLGGTSPLALVQFLKDRPGIRHVALCLDNDGAGKSGAEKLMETLRSDRELSGRIETLREAAPPERHGKDYNQQLQGVLAEMENQRRAARTPHGKQSVKKLMNHYGTKNAIKLVGAPKDFDRIAREYHVDYAFHKTGPGQYLLFFKADQADAITAAFSRYTEKTMGRGQEKPSILGQLRRLVKELAAKPRQKERAREPGKEER